MDELPSGGGRDERTERMAPDELYRLFEIIAGFDPTYTRVAWPKDEDFQRQQAVKDAWYSVIAHVPMEFADRAVRDHYANTSNHITPDVVYRAWVEQADIAARQATKEQVKASVSRAQARPASMDARMRAKASLWVRKGKTWEEAMSLVLAREQRLSVTCPTCTARIGSPCVSNGKKSRPMSGVHASRVELVEQHNDDAGAA